MPTVIDHRYVRQWPTGAGGAQALVAYMSKGATRRQRAEA